MNGQYKTGAIVFNNWAIKRKIGEGSFGKVFEIERRDFGETYRAALKIITVPQSEAEVQAVFQEGMNEKATEDYFYSIVEDVVREFALMAKLKGTANVVNYEDHMVIKHGSGFGWDILIRMELLTPLLTYAYEKPFSRRDIIRLGIDMCQALELCQKYNVIHRDIKPENIFVSGNGDFKLGDFGIARTIEKTVSDLSKKGTSNYMAPEVYRGGEYGFNVDIYSLGIVLYRFLNKNRVPFLPPAPEPISYSQRERALAKRMGGERIPAPIHAEGRLAEIIAKSVAFAPKDRYDTPMQLRQELEAIQYGAEDGEIIYPDGDELALAENIYLSQNRSKEEANSEIGTAAVFEGTPERGTDRAEEPEATESIFSVNRKKRQVTPHEADRTEHVFSGKESSASKPDRKKKNFLVPIIIVIAILGVSSAVFVWHSNEKRAAEKLAYYEILLQQAEQLYVSSPAEAGELLLEAQMLFPNEVSPYVSYAYSLYCARNFSACVDYIEQVLMRGKKFDVYYQNQVHEILGAAYFEQSEYAAAAASFRFSAAGEDMTISAMRDYAVSLGRLGDVDAAEDVLRTMFDAGSEERVTQYVQAEIDFAQKEYTEAERGFLVIYNSAENAELQLRAMRSLAEVYRDCAILERLNNSPISLAATKEAELLAEGIVKFGLRYDSTLWEMLAQAYFDAYHTNPALDTTWLERSADAFWQVLDMGMNKQYLYSNLFAIYFELNDFDSAEAVLRNMEETFPNSYLPHGHRAMLLIEQESTKENSLRNYQAAYDEYLLAEKKLVSSDDATLFQQIKSLMSELESKGWL